MLALGDRVVEIDLRLDVALGVHAHEGGELQEPGIDPPHRTRIAQRHTRDRLRSNQPMCWPVASSFTFVDLMRVSIGPAIRVSDSGWQG